MVLSVCIGIKELPSLPKLPSAAGISEFVAQLEELMMRMDPTSYGPTEPHLWVVGKILPKTWENCRDTSERKAHTHFYDEMIDLQIKLAMGRDSDSHMDKYLHKHLRSETAAKANCGGRSFQPHCNPGTGRRGQVKHMQETPPSNGKLFPNIFHRRPTDDQGGACHTSQSDGQSACMLQLQRKQKTKDGQEMKHQDHFGCTITCGYCGKRRQYQDECHIRRRESEKHTNVEEEKRRHAGKGSPDGGGCAPGRSAAKGNPGGRRRSSARPPNFAPKGKQHGAKKTAPRPSRSTGSAKKGGNATKQKLNWHSQCLKAAGAEVKFREVECGGGSEVKTWFSGSLLQ